MRDGHAVTQRRRAFPFARHELGKKCLHADDRGVCRKQRHNLTECRDLVRGLHIEQDRIGLQQRRDLRRGHG